MKLTNKGLAEFAKAMVTTPTIYVYGGYGQRLTEKFITYKAKQYPKQNSATRVAKFRSLLNKGYYGFDCVGLIKCFYWGGVGNLKYKVAQDKSANGMYNTATVKGDIKTMPEVPGVLVWMDGHIGIYIGMGEVVECTPRWKDGVQITKLTQRVWLGWCECPYIEYVKEEVKEEVKIDKPSDWAEDACMKVQDKTINGDGKGYYGWQEPLTLERLVKFLDNLGLLDK